MAPRPLFPGMYGASAPAAAAPAASPFAGHDPRLAAGQSPVPTATMGNPFSGMSSPWANDPRSGMQIVGDIFTGFGGGAGAVQQVQAARAQQQGQGVLSQLVQQAMAQGQDPIRAIMTSPQLPEIMAMPDFPQQLEALKGLAGGGEMDTHTAKLKAAGIEPGTPEAQAALFPPQQAPSQPADVETIIAMGGDPKDPAAWERLGAVKRLQQQPGQGPQPSADIQMLQFVGDSLGVDINTPEGLDAAIKKKNEMNVEEVTTMTVPADHELVGRNPDGTAIVKPITGSKTDVERKRAAEGKEKILSVIGEARTAIKENPNEFGLMGTLKEGARAATSAVAQITEGVPILGSTVGKTAKEVREGPLKETGATHSEMQVKLDLIGKLLAQGGFDGTPEGRAAQQEINFMRAAVETGDLDLATVDRRLAQLEAYISGDASSPDTAPASSASPPSGLPALSKPAEQMSAQDAEAYINSLDDAQMNMLGEQSPELLDQLIAKMQGR